MNPIISTEKLSHVYETRTGEKLSAITEIDFEVRQGEFVAIVGHNGSGKSTLAKHFNALLLPTSGRVLIDGLDSSEADSLWPIRQRVGMVFQNPDNQIVATTVEEDVAFGPENLGVPSDEIGKRIEESLRAVDMLEYREHAPHRLSGGQKQRVAIAGVIVCIIIFGTLFNGTMILGPIYQGKLIDSIVGNDSLSEVFKLTAVFVLFILMTQIFRYMKRFYIRRFANSTSATMRLILYNNIMNRRTEELKQVNTGDLMTKAVSDVELCVEGMRKFTTELFDTGVLMLSYLITLFVYDVRTTILSVLFVPVAMFLAEKLKSFIYRYSIAYRKKNSEVTGITYEYIDNSP
jgi:ABC-type multidrug transport system fused ATPase/permease subunit